MEPCSQTKKIDALKDQITVVKADLDEHRKAQQEQDLLREKNREANKLNDEIVNEKLDLITKQMEGLLELNAEVTNIKTAWKVGKSLGLGLAIFIATMSVIFGGIYAIKEWVKK